MDPFAQRMLEKAEQRSRALGISNAGNFQEFSNTETTLTNFDAARVPLTSQAQPKAPLPPPKEEQQQLQLSPLKPTGRAETLRILEQTSPSSKPGDKRCLRKFSAYDKENKDVGIEINILTDKQVEVQVQIEDRDESDLEDAKTDEAAKEPLINQPLARIRDTSRNRLQRLGALYSNSDDLSSPIHRTEEKFHAGGDEENENKQFEGVGKPKRPFGKLAALASTINQWEDDKAAGTAQAPPKPDLPSRCVGGQEAPIKQLQAKAQAPPPPTVVEAVENHGDTRTRVLNWDPKVINSLEAQGFQRRDTSTVRLAYDYTKDPKETEPKSPPPPISPKPARSRSREHEIPPPVVAKLASTFESTIEHNKHNSDRSRCPIKAGLVSNRAAAFEHIAAQSQQQPTVPLRDPTELTLRERMKLFERNKGEALLPKAAFGMAPSISQIRSNQEKAAITPRHGQQEKSPITPRYGQQEKKDSARDVKKDDTKAPASPHSSSSSISSTTTITNKPIDDLPNIRGKVAELIAIANSPSPERKIVNEVQRQRQEEMQQLANRFQKQKQLFQNRTEIQTIEKERQKEQNEKAEQHSKAIKDKLGAYTAAAGQVKKPTAPPPPAPPMQPIMKKAEDLGLLPNKRRSPAVNDSTEDESKRARKVDNMRLYPALSDLDTTNTSDTDNCCTTMSARSTEDELKTNDEEDENDDSRMYTDDEDNYELSKARLQKKFEGNDSEAREDSTADVCNGSFGREIMQVVQKNEHHQGQEHKVKQIKEVRYASENHYYDDAVGAGTSTTNESFDSSMNSSAASCGLSDNLKAQAVNDGDDDHTQDSDDDYDDEGDSSRVSRGSKGTTASNSFSFRKTPGGGYNTCKTISEEEAQSIDCLDLDDDDSDSDDAMMVYQTTSLDIQQKVTVHPVKSELKVNEENDNMVTLVHTVSFYRRQQTANSANSTPVRKHLPRLGSDLTSPAVAQTSGYSTQEISDDNDDSVSRDYGGDEAGDTDLDEAELVQDKIKKLLDEVCKQQQVIAQTSQALNLCAATIEFSGSTESVEGERHLLVATHRRQACLDEVQRLRVEKSLRPVGAPREKGRLTIKEITVPLRQDYIRKLAADTISGHHLVCLLKYNEHVLATKTVPTLPGLLAVKFPDVLQLENAYADFRVTLEIYGMTAQREVLPHEVKYHINLKKCGIKTPKKKTGENRLVMPPVQSPAGPHVVRTPALVQYGFAIFSLREIQRTTWSLTQVLGVSPLDGVVHMKVNCELSVCVEHKGFLTMFEDISGFGAWHRRWCHLNGTMLNYWKYPDDEKKKAPMGSIDLYTCTTQKVALAPRDICARLNTLLLECQRPAKDTDRESLIIVPFGRTTTVRHLLSADTKEEREEWCAYFNKALTLLRAWGPPQISN